MQGFLRCALIYCYFQKVSKIEDAGTSDKRLEEVEEENAKLREVVAKMEEELRVLGQHSAVMECEVSGASMARQRAEAKLGKLSEELMGLRAEHVELQEDHSILKEEVSQLEEKYSSTLEELSEVQASLERATSGKVVVEERYKHFQGEHRKVALELKEVKVIGA